MKIPKLPLQIFLEFFLKPLYAQEIGHWKPKFSPVSIEDKIPEQILNYSAI